MKYQNKSTGQSGESFAKEYLLEKGYQILQMNFSNKFGEIDIIARDQNTLVFVEVKTKTGIDFGSPEEMINKGKLSRVRHMGMIYTNGKSVPCRIDVIAIVLTRSGEVARLTHHENVY
ncbi:MAG TPA: YraN family protein [Patescibacteria group bacterium]|nr:YraN family protein [Patescibacteria group bacterium]